MDPEQLRLVSLNRQEIATLMTLVRAHFPRCIYGERLLEKLETADRVGDLTAGPAS